MRYTFSLFLLVLAAVPSQAHFLWIVPDTSDASKFQVVFSDSLAADDKVAIDKIAGTKLMVRDAAGKSAPLEWTKSEHAYLVNVTDKGATTIGGVCAYGVMQRGDNKPFLLNYYPKWIRGDAKDAKPWDQLPLEIIPRKVGSYQVLFGDKPAADVEVIVMPPANAEKETLKTDAQGEVQIKSTAPGLYGIRARHVEVKAGELDGKKYEEVRHYATLVHLVAEGKNKEAPAKKSSSSKPGASAKGPELPPLPEAMSSIGAAACDGWLYVYGGHLGKAHEYSTESVSGAFRRLSLKGGKAWEELQAGPALQGLTMVAHGSKLYRLGGMQPRNKPGEKSDNHSVATCACYDPATGKWETLPDLLEGRSSHDAVVIGDKIFVAGGWKMTGAGNKTEWHDSSLVLDLASKPLQWKAIKQPFHRRALTATAHEGKMYVMCGLAEEGKTRLAVDIFDPVKGEWTTGASVPGPDFNGFTPASCTMGGRLYLSTSDGKVWRLADKGVSWEEVAVLQKARFVHRMVPTGDGLLVVVGGASKSGNVAQTEVVEPLASR